MSLVDGGKVGASVKFKYLACVSNESSTEVAKCHSKVVNRRKVTGVTRHCLHLFCCTVVRKLYIEEMETSKIRVVQMDSFKGFLSIKRMDSAKYSD